MEPYYFCASRFWARRPLDATPIFSPPDPDEARRARGEAYFPAARALKLSSSDSEAKKLRDQVIKLLQDAH